MGDENFNFERFINFMKFMKLSSGTFWKFHWNIEVVWRAFNWDSFA